MRPDQRSAAYLPSLDGWRAIAVCLVLLDHAPAFGPRVLRHHLQDRGEQAVWLFFAISGLLICSRLLDEEQRYGTISLRNFYVRRGFRILPAAITYLLVVAILGALHVIPFERGSWLGAMFFYRNYWAYLHSGNFASWFTGHFWSLSVEEHFYFLLPGIMAFFPLRRKWILAALALVTCSWTAIFLHSFQGQPPPQCWQQRTEFCLYALLIPALLALTMRSERARLSATRWLSPWLVCMVVLVLAWFDSPQATNGRYWFQMVAVRALLNPILLLSTILHPASLPTRLLESAPLRFIGRISYSLYLWQTLFLTRAQTYAGPIHLLQGPYIGIACAFVCALASYYLIETPMIAVGRQFARRSQPPAELHAERL